MSGDRLVGNEHMSFRAKHGPVPPPVRASMTPRKSKKSIPSAGALQSNVKTNTVSVRNANVTKLEPGSAYKINRVVIPGNAGAAVVNPVPLVALPDPMTRASKMLDVESGRPSILRLQAMSPNMLQMETLKQEQQLNRMASIRHSVAVHAMNNTSNATLYKIPHEQPSKQSVQNLQRQATVSRPTGVMGLKKTEDDDLSRSSIGVKPSASALALQSRRKLTFVTPEEAAEMERKKESKQSSQPTGSQQWETVTTVRANELYNVTKYRSVNTGLEIIHAKLDSPTVHGYFVTPHKCEDDCGLPHILAHMIFLGSRNYPFPGVLDQLASKCFAKINAWTDSDHACYILTTAGKQGFLTLLPIYMDHIFFPGLGEAGFLTEVHHVNGEGRDGGVCYLEMQAIEHDPQEHGNWSLLREIYSPESGYYYNYGGYSKEMRDSCTLQSVRQFHKKFYHPKNCCLVICGDLEKEELFSVINPFMDVLQDTKSIPTDWSKPWQTELPVKIPDPIESIITYPSESEGMAFVKVGIVGPEVTTSVSKSVAMHILLEYMLESPVSPIQMQFVEHENALATHVYLTEINHTQTIYTLNFENVPLTDMEGIPWLLRKLFEKQTQPGGLDMERMEYIVGRCYQQALSAMENLAEDTIARAVISDYLYGKDDELAFDHRINHAYTIDQFRNQSPTFWIKMTQVLLNSNWATVYMIPSKDDHKQFNKEEEERVEMVNEKLGDSGRKKLAARLKAAIKIKSREAPLELVNSVITPEISSIGFLGIERQSNPSWASETLCNLYLDDINSSYVYLTTVMDTSELTLEEKKYLVLFAEAIVESPYVDNTQTAYTYEQMVAGLSRDVLKYETFFGLNWDEREGTRFSCGSYSHLFCIRFQLEMKKVKEGFEWMQLLLWNTKWKADRLKIIAQRMANDVLLLQDRGAIMTHAMLAESLYQMNSNVKAMSLIRQQVFLERISQELPKSFKRVAKMLEAIRMVILRPENTTVHVATSLPKMEFYLTEKPEVRDAISQLLRRTFDYTGWHWGYTTKRLANDPDSRWMKGKSCIGKCVPESILRMHSDEGSYLIQACPCIRNYNDPEYPIILTTIQYFCQHEGPFFKAIKGSGFASGYFMKVKPEEGMLYFELRPCVNLVGAYCAAFDIILEHIPLNGMEEGIWKESLLQSAKSSAIFDLIEQENTPRNLALHSLLDHFHEVDDNFNRNLMEQITKVSLEDVMHLTRKYFKDLFIETTTCAVSAPAESVPAIIKGLMDHCGKRLALLPPVHQSEMAAFV